uniref:uncharacterized protein LOC125907229 n=1 Tax=Anopheles coluzzii TaxID=1518534 RepID=UPI0020FF7B52|nr:uncharacterized protein LOC125907229 [Anopheles coluzzii]
MTRVWERSSDQCRLATQYSGLLLNGLQDEHLCFENQPFLVPGSCDTILGSPIEKDKDEHIYIHGINLFGRDNGFGEPAVGVRLSAHKAWLESVLLPHSKNETFVYIDPDLEPGTKCGYANGTRGTCMAESGCPVFRSQLQQRQQITFCSHRNNVCCPNTATNSRMMAIEKEITECEERYRHLRTDRQNGSSHAVKYIQQRSVSKRCYKAGSPIVWRKALNDTGYVEYLVHLYSYGSCKSNIPRVVARIAAYIEWFKEVLQ